MNMTDKLVFSLPKIHREFHDKTALNFISYKIQNFYKEKMCVQCSILYALSYKSLNILKNGHKTKEVRKKFDF